MRLLRYGPRGAEKPGMLDCAGRIRSLAAVVEDIDRDALSRKGLARLRKLDPQSLPLVRGNPRLGPCVKGTLNFIAIGLNYREHITETHATLPKEPIIFQKSPTCIIGPYDDVMMPRGARKLDWEVELCVVIGERARYLNKKDALDVIAGYTICNDISERYFQLERGEQWAKGKGCETCGPIGPWLVTRDEIEDVQSLELSLYVNDQRRQHDNTRTMIFTIQHLVWYVSQFFVLEPGDLITTGTPPGVGLGIKPTPTFLEVGDTMRLSIEHLGEQQQKVVRFKL